MAAEVKREFGRLRSFFWPVYKEEIKVFVPMLLIFFCITLNYNVLRSAKDALVITAESSGAEALPFLKTWAILPMAIFMTYLFTRFSNRFRTEQVFYMMMGIFLSFFLIFVFVIYPFHQDLHPHAFADRLEESLPLGFHGLIAMFRNWTFTAFYVMAELWGTAIMTVLFWGFANQVTAVDSAKRLYALLAFVGNLSSIFAGEISTLVSGYAVTLETITQKPAWENSLVLIASIVLISGLAAIFLFRWLHRHALQNQSSSFSFQANPSEIKMGIRKNFAYLIKSKYLLYIALIVIAYNLGMNLTEVVWKDQLKHLYPNPNDFQAYMGKVIMWIGFLATTMALFCGPLIRKFNWTFAAMLPPFILAITGLGFFSLIFLKDFGFLGTLALLGSTPLSMIVLVGAAQHCLCRASKYTLFDNTKELAFIPLNQESKLKGKAAIDGIGSRLGKSGGALVYQFLLMLLGTISSTIPFVAIAFLVVVGTWFFAVKALGRQFHALSRQPPLAPDTEKQPQEATYTQTT